MYINDVPITVRISRQTKVYPKVSGLSRQRRNKQQQTLVEKQRKGLWRQNSLD